MINNHYQTIVTKYLGPTNCRGSRIKATIAYDSETKFSKTVSYDYEFGADENHFKAAEKLMKEHFENCEIFAHGYDHNSDYFLLKFHDPAFCNENDSDDEFIGPVNHGNRFPENWFWDNSPGVNFRKYPDDYPSD